MSDSYGNSPARPEQLPYTVTVLFLLTVSARPLEHSVLVALLVSLTLLFLPRRPVGLVWWSAASTVALALHLYLEEGRWQMVAAYALVLALALYLARPGSRRRGGIAVLARLAVVLVGAAGMALPLMVPVFRLPEPSGPYAAGTAQVRLGDAAYRVWYPAEPSMEPDPWAILRRGGTGVRPAEPLAPYWSVEELSVSRVPGWPWIAGTHLAIVPTPAYQRAAVIAGTLPLLVVLPGAATVPGDHLPLVLEAASRGWLVLLAPAGAGESDLVALLDAMTGGEDLAFEGRLDHRRVALVSAGSGAALDVGVPVLHVGGDSVLAARLAGGAFRVVVPGAVIPDAAYTARSFMVNPARFVIGGSDVPPGTLRAFWRDAVEILLGDGGADAPVFAGESPAAAASRLLESLPGALYVPISDALR